MDASTTAANASATPTARPLVPEELKALHDIEVMVAEEGSLDHRDLAHAVISARHMLPVVGEVTGAMLWGEVTRALINLAADAAARNHVGDVTGTEFQLAELVDLLAHARASNDCGMSASDYVSRSARGAK